MHTMKMRRRPFLSPAVLLVSVAALSGGCATDRITQPAGPGINVCHFTGALGRAIDVPLAALGAHKGHGDYVTTLVVGESAAIGDSVHFRRLTDALAVARAARIAHNELVNSSCRITIAVASGVRPGSTPESADSTFERFPFVIDVPDITVSGALKMQVDADGRATGNGETAEATIFAPSPALMVGAGGSQTASSEPIFVVNAHPDGSRGDRAVIEGFVFRSGRDSTVAVNGGQGVFSMRVLDIVVRGNKFENGFTEEIDLRASTGLVERNHLSGRANSCDICISGPGDYTVRDNRLMGPGGLPGILSTSTVVLPVPPMVEQITLPASALVTGVITNNEVRGHVSKPVGAGIRVGAIGLGTGNVIQSSRMTVTGNKVVGNTFAFIIDAAFPVAGNTRKGDVDATLSGNTISGSCQNDLLVSFTRHQSGLGLTSPFPSYLLNSTYTLTLGSEFTWETAWVAHPAGYGNTLVVNGQTIANVTRTAYDAARVCP